MERSSLMRRMKIAEYVMLFKLNLKGNTSIN
jgi:hypothetical protein